MRMNYDEKCEKVARLLIFLSEMSGRVVRLSAPQIADFTGYKNQHHMRKHLWAMYDDGILGMYHTKNGKVIDDFERGATTKFYLTAWGYELATGQKSIFANSRNELVSLPMPVMKQ